MYIKQLTIQGVKALDRTITLAPLTLVSGPNGSGKTAILEAIRFAFLGYCPGMGKRNTDLFDLCSANRMDVTAIMDTGRTVKRSLAIKGGAVSMEGIDAIDLESPCLDPDLYFSKSETGRVQYIFERCRIGGDLTREGIAARIGNLIAPPEDITEDYLRAKQDVIHKIFEHNHLTGGPQERLESLAAMLRDEFKQSNAAAKDSEGAVRQLTELRLTSAPALESVPTLEAQRAQLLSCKEDIDKEAGALAARAQEAERVERQRALFEKSLQDPVTTDAMVADAEKIVTEAKQALEVAQEAGRKAAAALDDTESVDLKAFEAAASRTSALAFHAVADERRLEVDVQDIEKETEALQALECCPHCQGKSKGWKTKLLDGIQARKAAAVEKHTAAKSAFLATQEAYEKAADALKVAQEKHAAIERLKQICVEESRAVDRAAGALREAEFIVSNQRKTQQQEQTVRRNAEQQLATLAAVERPDPADQQRISTEITAIRAKLGDIALKLDDANRAKNDLQRAEQAAQLHRAHAIKRDVLKQAGKAVVELKATLVAEAFQTLLERANQCVGDLLPAPLAYNPECNELGYWRGHIFVKHRTLSGVQKKLAYIGLSVALAWDAPFRIVLLDELTTATGDKAGSIIRRLCDLVENDVVHQVVVVEPSDNPEQTWCGDWLLVSTAQESEVAA